MELTPKGPHTQYWKKTSTGAERMTWLLNYDWNAKKAQFSYSDAATGKKEDKTLAFGENAMPGDALSWVVRGFPFEKDAGFQIVGQIVMTDGSILEGLIIHRGQEKLQTEFGALETYKLELKPASRFIGAVAPKSQPPAMVGTLGLVMFLYGLGVQFGAYLCQKLHARHIRRYFAIFILLVAAVVAGDLVRKLL